MSSIHLLSSCFQLWWLVTIHSIITFSRLFPSLLLMCPKHIHLHLFISDNQVYFSPIIYLICAFIIFSVQKVCLCLHHIAKASIFLVTINNFSKVTFISCYSKKLGILLVKSFFFHGEIFFPGFYKGSRGWIHYSSKFSSFYWTGSDG